MPQKGWKQKSSQNGILHRGISEWILWEYLLPIDKHDLSESGWVRLIKDAFMEGDKDMSGTLEFDEFLKLYRKVLADENVRKEFAKKTVLKYSDEGKWQIAISA